MRRSLKDLDDRAAIMLGEGKDIRISRQTQEIWSHLLSQIESILDDSIYVPPTHIFKRPGWLMSMFESSLPSIGVLLVLCAS
jgi:hypothetical protein